MKRKKLIEVFAAAFILGFICGCSSVTGGPNTADGSTLFWLKTADPKHDFAIAVANEDFRFCAVNGFAAGMIPGTDQFGADSALIQRYGSHTIGGTSDYGNVHLNELAWRYARTYNSLLLEHLRAKTKGTSNVFQPCQEPAL